MTELQPEPEPMVPDEDHSNGAAWTSPHPAGLPGHIRPWTPAEQAEHLAALAQGIAGFAVTVALGRARARSEGRS
ncbi:hypothetical protein PV396_24610 [Streptomyces sp. ME02-8801-2C]|uniref:hypothetical protein n=1 Tax=Streptomyces sp. ME02-8801-2C TaxID=3028680 RepID=UPI0029A6753C|nr:hypothetical protein [Streptomyces sp. ME02-8801-2C]MDX3455085.1 hypothetical protein [Streptomyces sp. ME02-8801-2C]